MSWVGSKDSRAHMPDTASAEMQMEDLHWYTASYSRIYNDVITLRKVCRSQSHDDIPSSFV